jgi:hypothetical protein
LSSGIKLGKGFFLGTIIKGGKREPSAEAHRQNEILTLINENQKNGGNYKISSFE